jgi:magnesium-transporting ATPase (P-type)
MSVDTSPETTRSDRRSRSERRAISLFRRDIVRRAVIDSFAKLDPRVQIHNPVMFVVEIGAAITTVTWLIQVFGGGPLGGGHEPAWYTFVISVWLWLTVVFANMAEAFAEGRGRAQADTLRSMRQETVARMEDGTERKASKLVKGDVVFVEAGEIIPGDGTVLAGLPPWTSPPSRASPPRSSANPAAIAARSRAAPGCCPIGSWWRSPRSRATRSWTR